MRYIFTIAFLMFSCSFLHSQQTLYGLYRATADTHDVYPPTYLCSVDIYTGAVTLISQQPQNLFYQFYFDVSPFFALDAIHQRVYIFDNKMYVNDSSSFTRIWEAPLSTGSFTLLDSFGLTFPRSGFENGILKFKGSSTSQYSINPANGDVYFWEAEKSAELDTSTLQGIWNRHLYRPVRYNAALRTFTPGNYVSIAGDTMGNPTVPSWSTYNSLDQQLHSTLPHLSHDLFNTPYVYTVDANTLTVNQREKSTLNTPHALWSHPYRLEYCRRTKKTYALFQYADPLNLYMGWVLGELNTTTGETTPVLIFNEYAYIYDVAVDQVNGVMCIQFSDDHYYGSSPMRLVSIDLVTETVYHTVTLQYPPGISIGNITDIEAMPSSLVVGLPGEEKPLLFSVFPNPTSQQLSIQAGDIDEPISSVTIFALSGKMMTKLQPLTNKGLITVDVSAWPAATYLVQVTSGNRTRAEQFIKQ